MKVLLTSVVLGGLLILPAQAEELILEIEGSFSESGFLSDGAFEGTISYYLDTPDSNPLTNVGSFDLSEFKISILDSQNTLVDELTEENSNGLISLHGLPFSSEAKTLQVSTTPATEDNGNAFFEHGSLGLTFDLPVGIDLSQAPISPAGEFTEGYFFSYDGTLNQQDVESATLNQPGQSVKTNEAQASAAILLLLGILGLRRAKR